MGKRIIIMRHAKSSWTSGASTDHLRPLNKRGRRDAPRIGARLQELRVDRDAQRGFFMRTHEPEDARLRDYFRDYGVPLGEGQAAEACLEALAWVDRMSTLLQRGYFLTIDYGYPADQLYAPARRTGTLLSYRKHQVVEDPLCDVGRQDITAHVDLSALERAASAAGLRVVGRTSQAEFLTRLGLGEMLGQLGRQPDTDMGQYADARAAVARLVDPRHLGGFRVIAWERPGANPASATHPLLGFATA